MPEGMPTISCSHWHPGVTRKSLLLVTILLPNQIKWKCLHTFKRELEILILQSQNRKPETPELQVILVAWLLLLSITVVQWGIHKCLLSYTVSSNCASADVSFPAQLPHPCLVTAGHFVVLCLDCLCFHKQYTEGIYPRTRKSGARLLIFPISIHAWYPGHKFFPLPHN